MWNGVSKPILFIALDLLELLQIKYMNPEESLKPLLEFQNFWASRN